jgi:hypothetical protein
MLIAVARNPNFRTESDVAFWHKADVHKPPFDVGIRGKADIEQPPLTYLDSWVCGLGVTQPPQVRARARAGDRGSLLSCKRGFALFFACCWRRLPPG